jgi:Uncharacterized protein, homolog of Cu resistance protein CopC
MMLHIPARHTGALVMTAWLAVMLVPSLVLAHAELKTPSPADRSVATPPVTEVSGIYSEAMDPTGSSILVKNTSGATVAKGTVDPADTSRMMATPATPLGIGSYSVEWTSVALDGHVERGTWAFTVAIAKPVGTATPSVAATAGPTSTTAPAPVTQAPSSSPTPAPSAGGSTTGSSGDVFLPIIVALIILGAGAAYLLTRRNRPPDPT